MRKILMVVLLTVAASVQAQDKSIVQLADPFILLDDNGTYYAYGTNAANGIEAYTSTDLLGWRKQNELALSKEHTTEDKSFWAPEVYKRGDTYYMYYSANEHLFVATATSARGPFKQVGGYLLDALLGDEKCIDPTVFFDDDGSVYLFFVRFTDGNCIWMCELEEDCVTPKAGTLRDCNIKATAAWETRQGKVCEGPTVIKNGSIYYLLYSANDFRSQDYAVGYARTRNLKSGAWNKTPDPIIRRVDGLVGTGHGATFTDKEGKLRYVFHAHDSETTVAPRRSYICTLEFSGSALRMADEPIIRPTTPGRVGIEEVKAEPTGSAASGSEAQPMAYFDLSGRAFAQPQRGLNLTWMPDGTLHKLVR